MAGGGEADQRAAFGGFRTLANAFVVNVLTGPKIARNGEHLRIRIVTREVSSRFIPPVGLGWLLSFGRVGVVGYGGKP